MKRVTFFLLSLAVVFTAAAQKQELKMETFYLSNGLKVIIAEDHSEPKIFGAVVVHAGSKNEDTSATGVAHYFEHIMFKGTDRIGTVDWATESLYLDSISRAYDRLHDATSDEERHTIQLEINRLNIEASKYAIANETDAILQQMGCTGLNAGTSYDFTVYYNYLPSNQLENWMDVYVERFRNPVYRLFQGELEAVYEEKNIQDNNTMNTFIRGLFTEAFGEHPYSREVIGYGRHLKCPQPSQMKVFYDKYYVASNMTLLLVGDLDIATARRMAEKRFSVWPRGEKVAQPKYDLPRFEQQVIKKVKQTPIPMGMIIFPGVNSGHRDELALDVMSSIISGGNGSLDVLASDGKILGAQLIPVALADAGVNAILYLPIPVIQNHEKAEKYVWECLDSVKAGRFSDELLESIKMNALRSRIEQLESLNGIANLLESLELAGSSYKQWLADNERLQRITREDIMDVARRYFSSDRCTIIRSSIGFPAKESAVKPDWDHLDAQNIGAQSDFARMIADRRVKPITPQYVDIKKDLRIEEVTPNCRLYAVGNPKNDIFTLDLYYHYGTIDNRDLETALEYFSMIGADSMKLQEYNIELERLGGRFSFEADDDDDYCHISISGFEQNFDRIIELVMLKLNHPRIDQQQITNMVEAMNALKRQQKKDPGTWASALYDYIMLGDSSKYINHMTIKQLKKMHGEDFIAMLEPIFGRDGYVTYVGNRDPKDIATMLTANNLVRQEVTVVPEQRYCKRATLGENRVFYCSNKDFVKSDIDIRVESSAFDMGDQAAAAMFNEYMGGGMNGVFFQEIREFRALGYSTYGRFHFDFIERWDPYMYAYLGTQCDKTNDGVDAMLELIANFPERENKFISSRDYLVSVRNSNYIGFRDIPYTVRYWMEVRKLDADPRAKITDQISHLTYSELRKFHEKYLAKRPTLVFISGNAKKFDLKALGKYGKVQKVKFDQMIRY